MMGSEKDRGLVPRMIDDLFDRKIRFMMTVSYLEIHTEVIHDLLNPHHSASLKIRQGRPKDGGVYVENLTEVAVSGPADIFRLIEQGNRVRHVSSTKMNSESSRSHTILTLKIQQKIPMDSVERELSSKLTLVDLAGSERCQKTGATRQRLKEGAAINQSLMALGGVIHALVSGAQVVPYRNSKLTHVLRESLGGNARTVVVANVSPADYNADETLRTLKYASQAKMIHNNVVRNDDNNGAAVEPSLEDVEESLKKALEYGAVPWRRTKLMIVGQGRVGKTCLLQRLKGATPSSQQKSTIGAEKTELVRSIGLETSTLHEWSDLTELGKEHLLGLRSKLESHHHHQQQQRDEEQPDDGTDHLVASSSSNNVPTAAAALTPNDGATLGEKNGKSDGVEEDHHHREDVAIAEQLADRSEVVKAIETTHRRVVDEFTKIDANRTNCDVKETAKMMHEVELGLRISVWDFGGQEVFHTVHNKFLTRKGAYLVVFNMAKKGTDAWTEARNELTFWLNSIAIHAHGAPVFVVGTHAKSAVVDVDLLSTEITAMVDDAGLQESLQRTRDASSFFAVDTIYDDKEAPIYAELKRAIEASIENDPDAYVKKDLPLAWLFTCDELQCECGEEDLYFTDVEGVNQVLNQVYTKMPPRIRDERGADECIAMLTKFDDLGVISHFGAKHGRATDRLVIMQPQWILDMFAAVIRNVRMHRFPRDAEAWTGQSLKGRQRFYDASTGAKLWKDYSQDGILDRRLLEYLWPDKECKPGEKPENWQPGDVRCLLLDVMTELRLVVPYRCSAEEANTTARTTEKYLVPSILPYGEPTGLFCQGGPPIPQMQAKIEVQTMTTGVKYLPSGCFSRLLASLAASADPWETRCQIRRSAAHMSLNNGAIMVAVSECRSENAILVRMEPVSSRDVAVKRVRDALEDLSVSFYSSMLEFVDRGDVDQRYETFLGTPTPPSRLVMGGDRPVSSRNNARDEFQKEMELDLRTRLLRAWFINDADLTDRIAGAWAAACVECSFESPKDLRSINDLDDVEVEDAWKAIQSSGRGLNAVHMKKIKRALIAAPIDNDHNNKAQRIFAGYITDKSDETRTKLTMDAEGLIKGVSEYAVGKHRIVNVEFKAVDNVAQLCSKLDRWSSSRTKDENSVAHVCFHNNLRGSCLEKLADLHQSGGQYGMVLNSCNSSSDLVCKKMKRIVAWKDDVDAGVLALFNEGFYVKFALDYPDDENLWTGLDGILGLSADAKDDLYNLKRQVAGNDLDFLTAFVNGIIYIFNYTEASPTCPTCTCCQREFSTGDNSSASRRRDGFSAGQDTTYSPKPTASSSSSKNDDDYFKVPEDLVDTIDEASTWMKDNLFEGKEETAREAILGVKLSDDAQRRLQVVGDALDVLSDGNALAKVALRTLRSIYECYRDSKIIPGIARDFSRHLHTAETSLVERAKHHLEEGPLLQQLDDALIRAKLAVRECLVLANTTTRLARFQFFVLAPSFRKTLAMIQRQLNQILRQVDPAVQILDAIRSLKESPRHEHQRSDVSDNVKQGFYAEFRSLADQLINVEEKVDTQYDLAILQAEQDREESLLRARHATEKINFLTPHKNSQPREFVDNVKAGRER